MIKMLRPKVLGASAVGAAVGFTAHYAVTKVLFKPKQTVDFASTSIPIKGILPSMQPKVANATEEAINAILKNPKLFATVQNVLTKPEIKDFAVNSIIKFIYETADKKSINELIAIFLNDEKKEVVEKFLKEFITKVLIEKTDKEYLGKIITNEGIKIFKEATSNSLLSKLMNEKIFASIANAISAAVHKFVETKATQKILDIVFNEIDTMMDMTLPEILEEISLNSDEMRRLINIIYDEIIHEIIPEIFKNIDAGAAVKEGINKIDFEKIDDFVNTRCQPLVFKFSVAGAIIGGVTTNILASKILLK